MITHVETLKEARKLAREIKGTYRKVRNGYLVMDYVSLMLWKRLRGIA